MRLSNGKASKGNSTPAQLFDLIHPEEVSPTEGKVDAAIQWLYDRVLLRSPTPEEQARLRTFAMKSMKSDGKLLGARNLISAVLLKPEALYRSELAQGQSDEHGRALLAPREIAYALAYALTDARPDRPQAAKTTHPRFLSRVLRIRRGNRCIQGRSAQPQSRAGGPGK